MSLKRNILANYASQIYVTLAGIIVLPMYLRLMGPEAYGLVGFFTLVQALFSVLDMGLSPTVSRETARFHGGAVTALNYRKLLRALQILFLAVALVGGVAMFALSGTIALRWLTFKSLPPEAVIYALQLMAAGVALRWMSGLYRGIVSGAEQMVWLGGFNAFIATLRFLLVIPMLQYVDNSIGVFFIYQALVAAIELIVLAGKTHAALPPIGGGERLGWTPATLLAPIGPVVRFSLGIAFTSTVWVLITQTDKLILSKLLPLADYGFFTLAVLAASGIMMISGPISSALLPRLTRIQATGDAAALIALYRNATKLVVVLVMPACLVLAFFAEPVMWAWTGNRLASVEAAPVLRLYAVGNGFMVLSAFPFYLQFAKGELRLHLRGNALFAVILIPLIIVLATSYGMQGAGYAWLICNVGYFIAWVPLVHRQFLPGLHATWLTQDLAGPVVAGLAACGLMFASVHWSPERWVLGVQLVCAGAAALVACALGLADVRRQLRLRLNSYFASA